MHRLSFLVCLVTIATSSYGQSPHGDDFVVDCARCHNPNGWTIIIDTFLFNHDTTQFALEGAHTTLLCISCHTSLVFDEAPNDCISCHTNMHSASVGNDCVRCHNSSSWLVDDIPEIHEKNGFPLVGVHSQQACIDCHLSETHLRFDRIGNDCINCHRVDFDNTKDPDHRASGFSMECADCHDVFSSGWQTEFANHDFFPLILGHDIQDCSRCHNINNFSDISPVCISCHQNDFAATVNPDHQEINLSTDCASCHTTDPEWMPASFDIHDDFYTLLGAHAAIANECATCHSSDYTNTPNDCVGCHLTDYNTTSNPNHTSAQFPTDCDQCHNETAWEPSSFDHDEAYFPIYSGDHEGTWTECITCHKNPANFGEFTCIACHTNPETDDEHLGISGYIFEDNVCLVCHPTGSADMAFDHNATNFPLTGAHIQVECSECHINNQFVSTSTDCISCHTMDFSNAVNPDHQKLNLSTDCASCHTTDPEWMPASFDIHDDFYPLVGAHAAIAKDCASCHSGDYTNTSSDCIGCHLNDYNTTSNPNHASAQFPTDCDQCHNEIAWQPSTFDHDGMYFPIYSGDHDGVWNQCAECHSNTNNFAEFTCIGCHTNPETDDEHLGISGYTYDDNACLVCHPTGNTDMAFDHNTTNFPLTGSHTGLECLACHDAGFAGTTTDCAACHTTDFNGTSNPNHKQLGLPSDCVNCHTTDPAWMPARFEIHDQYYPLNGAHATISNDCAACHNGNYINTPNDCIDCHLSDYNNANNPNHDAAQFPTDCTPCHNETAWEPSTFNHDGMYFPIYSGNHRGEWNTCNECHTNPNNYSAFSCINCHEHSNKNDVDDDHDDVSGYVYESNACFECHPNGDE